MAETQPAQNGLENQSVVNTKCTICRGKRADKREAINAALGKGLSHKDIEALTGVPSRTIGNHAQHLPELFRQAKERGILEQPIDVYREFRELLDFAKPLCAAAREYLSDDSGKIVLVSRAHEISVMYEDSSDKTAKGDPKRKIDSLEALLERAEAGGVSISRAVVKHVDIRSFALDAIRTGESCIDKFAKLGGDYQENRRNEADMKNLAERLTEKARELIKDNSDDPREMAKIFFFFQGFMLPNLPDDVKNAVKNEFDAVQDIGRIG